MDENAKLLLELTRKQERTSDRDPILHDVKSLLEEGRKRVYTPEGQKLVDSTSKGTSDKS